MKAAVYLFFGLFAYTSSLPMTLLQKSIPTKGGKLGLGDIWSNCGECMPKPESSFKFAFVLARFCVFIFYLFAITTSSKPGK